MSTHEDEGGSPLGALVGFLTGGPVGAIVGWKVGRRIAAAAKAAFEEILPELEMALQRVNELDPQQKAEIVNKLLEMQTQYNQMNQRAQRRYETRVSAIQGMAASAGIAWSPH